MISVAVVGDRQVIARLSAMPGNLQRVLYKRIYGLTLRLQARVQQKLSGDVLNVRTGALRRSIQNEVTQSESAVTGRVFSSGDVKYAAIHEFGGTIHHPGGTPYFKGEDGTLRFVGKDSMLADILPKTRPHDIVMPERSFMRSSFREMQTTIRETIQAGLLEAALAGSVE